MALQYTNRVGKTYHLREGKTRTGKPKYFFSMQQNGKGKTVNEMPEGYEIYEHSENAQVFLRKKLTRLIGDIEEQYVRNQLNSLKRARRYIVDCKNKYITIYESNRETGNIKGIFGNLLNNTNDSMAARTNIFEQNYTAMLRFHLDDKEKRTFTVERFCFRVLNSLTVVNLMFTHNNQLRLTPKKQKQLSRLTGSDLSYIKTKQPLNQCIQAHLVNFDKINLHLIT